MSRAKIGAIDSDGMSLRVSIGNLQSPSNYFGGEWDNFEALRKIFVSKRLVVFSGDCIARNSGGPVLNSKGVVVGVFIASTTDTEEFDEKNVCASVKGAYIREQLN